MNFIRLLPVLISYLLLSAHCLRNFPPLILIPLTVPLFLFIAKPWPARIVQAFLVIGSLEWIRTLIVLANQRIQDDQPWTRMAIILAVVAAFTLASAFVFQNKSLKQRYQLGKDINEDN